MLFSIILACVVISGMSFLGSLTLLGKGIFKENYAASLVSFAAGVMLSAAFLDLLPEALEEKPEPVLFTAVFAGMIVFFFLERFVLWFHHHHDAHGAKPTTILVLVGDGIHNFIDGVAIAATFLTSPALGLTTMLAIAAHEIPQELADFSILTANGMPKKKALWFNFLSGLTAIAGGIFGFFFLENFAHHLWWVIAFTAGMFLYIASSDLIPELHREFSRKQKWQHTLPFVIGIVLFWCITYLVEG
jgi:zinc and cadmium transporter